MNTEIVFLTIISQNYVPQARCLFESLRVHHPDSRHVVCLIDESVDPDIFSEEEFEVVLAKDVVSSGFYDMAYRYSLVELSTSVKPFAMRWLIEEGAQFVTYIDPDCYLFSPLLEVFELFEDGANIVLTPHATQPIEDAKTPGETDFLRVGTFNLGFVAVHNSVETRRFLNWWTERLRDLCLFDPRSGLFVDQKWADLAPCFFTGVVVLRHPGYNVAYWNAFQRPISRATGGWQINGQPLRFFHFSGLPKEDVSEISRFQDRLDGQTIGPFISEFHTYLARMASYGLKPQQETRYAYSLYWHGEPVESQALRTSLRRSGVSTATEFKDLRNEKPIVDLLKAHPDLPIGEMFPISPLLYDAWLGAPTMALQYPLFSAEQRARFLYWVLTEGYAALQIDKRLLPWRELMTPVPGALGGRLAVPPVMWLIWLSDKKLRNFAHFEDDASYASLILELQRQVSNGERPSWVLPSEYTGLAVVGDGHDAVSVAKYAIWSVRQDLRAAFDVSTAHGRRDFNSWCRSPSLAAEYPWMASLIDAQS